MHSKHEHLTNNILKKLNKIIRNKMHDPGRA